MRDLAGKVAIVTGAASGIGLATGRLLASFGTRVVMTDINRDGVLDAAGQIGGDAIPLLHDVTRETDWAEVFDTVAARCGRLDILVNNAGIMVPEPFETSRIETLRRQFAINVESVYFGMRGALPLMQKTREETGSSPSIINISSVYGKVAGSEFSAYSATKGAVRAMTRAVASELAAKGVRVNCVLPGPAATNLSASWEPPRDAHGNPLPPEEALAAWVRLIPMGRIGTAEDIAPVIAFLASDMARFVTGAEYIVDGAYTAV